MGNPGPVSIHFAMPERLPNSGSELACPFPAVMLDLMSEVTAS
jgi:hypothetical protein